MKSRTLLDWPPGDPLLSGVAAVVTAAFAVAVATTAAGAQAFELFAQGLFLAAAVANLAIGAPRLAAGVGCIGLSGMLGSPYAATLPLTVLSWALMLAGLAAVVQVFRHGTATGRLEAYTAEF
jgi:hypothetical protein